MCLLLANPSAAQFGAEPAELELIQLREDLYVLSNPAVPGLVTALITAGGGSAKERPQAVAAALELDFETVVPGHGLISTRADLEAYYERTLRFREVLSALVSQGKSRDEIEAVVRADFDWEDFHVQSGLDGLIEEFR